MGDLLRLAAINDVRDGICIEGRRLEVFEIRSFRGRGREVAAPETCLALLGEGIDGHAIEPCVEVHVGHPPREGRESIQTAIARDRDGLTTLHRVSLTHQCSCEMGTARSEAASVIEHYLETTAVELGDDARDTTRRCGRDARADRDGEVRAIVAVVGELSASKVF